MRAENLPAIQSYVEEHIGTATTRHASEERFSCPPLADAIEAERAMRTTLHVMFDGHVVPPDTDPAYEPHDDLSKLKTSYWDLAKHVTSAHGAKPNFELDDYFHVGQDRHYEAIKASVFEEYAPGSIPIVLFESLDYYQQELGLDIVSASRVLTTLLNTRLSTVKKSAYQLQAEGVSPMDATTAAISNFAATEVPEHVAQLKQRVSEGLAVTSAINKASLYPAGADNEFDDMPLRLNREDAQGLMMMYRMQERPYGAAELALAETLVRMPAMQQSILLVHKSMVEYATEYLTRHPERMQYSLEPFSEIFVPISSDEGITLVPNPKLIKVIANNTVPAIAKVLIEQNCHPEDLTGDHVQLGIEQAKKLRVFQAQIGQFTDYDSATDSVALTTLFSRTCPAMQMFTEALTKRLPDMYDSCR